MTYKWDVEVAENYAKKIASKICEENFVDVDALDGELILDITPVKQVNLLVIRLLYSRWQEETRRLQSPYFDFNHPEVQYALSEFMNILSEFIAVRQREFEPLLVEAITNTLQLGLKPKEYFSKLLRDLPNFRLSAQWVKKNRNYFQLNKWVFDELEIIADQHPSMYANEVIELIHKKLDHRDAEDISGLMQSFNELLEIPDELKEIEKVENAVTERQPGKSFFDSIVEDKLTDRIRQNVSSRPIIQEEEIKPREINVTPEVVAPTAVVEIVRKVEETIVPKPEPLRRSEEKLEIRSINEQHVNLTQSLNDKATTTAASMTDYHRLGRVDSIRKSISLNQRFLFIKYLFGDNADLYNNSLDEIDQLQNYDDARSFVINNYVPRFNWNVKGTEVDEFFEVLKRRFS